MLKTTLNFFGEEVIIDTPKDIASLRGKITEKYLLSPSDAAEIIIYYIKDGKKIYVINGNDFSQYKDSKIPTLFLDVNQNSRLYIDSTTQLDKEKEKKEKELAELNHKYKQISDKKKDIENDFNIQLRELSAKIMELNKKKCEIIKKKDKELIKLIQEEEQFEEKIYYLQKKLSIPITVPIPKEEMPKEILKNSPRMNLRFAPLRDPEAERKRHIEKCKLASIAKCIALSIQRMKKMNTIPNEESKDNDLILSTKLKSIAKAKKDALLFAKKMTKSKSEEEKIKKCIAYSKYRAVAKAKALNIKVGKKAEEDKMNKAIKKAKKKAIAKAKAAAKKVGDKAEQEKILKAIKYAKYKSVAKAKCHAKKVGEKAEEEIKLKAIASAKNSAKKLGEKTEEDIRLRTIANAKLKSVAKAKAEAKKIGEKAEEEIKLKSISRAKSAAKKLGIKTEEGRRLKSIAKAKLRSVAKAKSASKKIGEKAEEDRRQKAIKYAKYKSVAKAKCLALKVGKMAEKAKKEEEKKEEKNPINTVNVFQKVNEVLGNAVEKVKEYAKDLVKNNNKKEEETKKEDEKEEKDVKDDKDEKEKKIKEIQAKKLKEKERKEKIDKIVRITRETINEINGITRMVMAQSNLLIEQINNPDKKLNLSSDDIVLRAAKKDVKKKEAIHFGYLCDGCRKNPIRGNRYKCKVCPDFDFCESCYKEQKEKHGHEFILIERPKNTRRMGHKNTKYCQRGIVHRNVRCEGCGLDPLVGWRYMCTICDDYNLCENCEETNALRHGHPFIKVTYPGLADSFKESYFKMNYYDPENTK